MAEILPFKGILYNQKKIKDLSKVISPPYDIISFSQQNRFYRTHPCNIIRIDSGRIFPRDDENDNRYTRARNFFQRWLKQGILIQDELPSIYLYAQDYTFRGENFLRLGLICRLKLKDDGTVLFHEKTSSRPKKDRFKLLSTVKANINPIFTLFEDDSGLIPYLKKLYLKRVPFIDFDFDGIRNRLWRINNDRLVRKIKKIFFGKFFF